MPIYEYGCSVCGKRHEILRKFSDAPLEFCPDCGGKLKKLISNTSFVLKGTGWYVTDYASPDRKSAAQKEKSPNVTEPKAEPKTEKKTEAKAA